ncbi:MAG: hypothetical protein ABI606_24135 [Rhodoferax sp.]
MTIIFDFWQIAAGWAILESPAAECPIEKLFFCAAASTTDGSKSPIG